MNHFVCSIDSPQQIADAAFCLRETLQRSAFNVGKLLEVFERWAAALDEPRTRAIPGVTFLRLWLRRGTLEPIVRRELGAEALDDGWRAEGRVRLRTVPVGVVGHWPAGNIEIQPILSATCALLGGNACLVRVPTGLVEPVERIAEALWNSDDEHLVRDRIVFASFDHSRRDLHEAMAQCVDGAMIWGGEEAVTEIRSLPFPHYTHIEVFGPRISVAAMDHATWNNAAERSDWCRRIARDVWQFDQQACSSPQTLFLECDPDGDTTCFLEELTRAFEGEDRAHPRTEIEPAQTSAICHARATWLLADGNHTASFPPSPDWTILSGEGSEIPKPTHGRTLTVLKTSDLMKAINRFDGSVQTLGVAIQDERREEELVEAAARHGVDRVVRLGQMHVFGSPWDGVDLVRSMTRLVRHGRSQY